MSSPTEPKWTRVKILKDDTDEIIDDKKFLQQTEDMNFTQEWNSFEKEKKKFLEEWAKTYDLICGTFCTSKMKTAIKDHPEFEEKVRDKPIELLKAISVLMYTPVRARYPFITLAKTLSSLSNLRQIKDKNLVD